YRRDTPYAWLLCCCAVFRSCLCFTRPPYRPTLLPYTTLFRSGAEKAELRSPGRPGDRAPGGALKTAEGGAGHRMPHLQLQPSQPDRKSTRLNSSHVSISYAVFCLKEKKSTTLNYSHVAVTQAR